MSTNLWISEDHCEVIDGESRRYWSSDAPSETFAKTPGELYRALRREYGRCVSKVYRDTADGVEAIGWVFHKRVPYEDREGSYLREVWITVHAPEPIEVLTSTWVHPVLPIGRPS